eukprot:COSAG01_NODE_7571_length_3144_cov_2.034811_1_plen_523_part_00
MLVARRSRYLDDLRPPTAAEQAEGVALAQARREHLAAERAAAAEAARRAAEQAAAEAAAQAKRAAEREAARQRAIEQRRARERARERARAEAAAEAARRLATWRAGVRAIILGAGDGAAALTFKVVRLALEKRLGLQAGGLDCQRAEVRAVIKDEWAAIDDECSAAPTAASAAATRSQPADHGGGCTKVPSAAATPAPVQTRTPVTEQQVVGAKQATGGPPPEVGPPASDGGSGAIEKEEALAASGKHKKKLSKNCQGPSSPMPDNLAGGSSPVAAPAPAPAPAVAIPAERSTERALSPTPTPAAAMTAPAVAMSPPPPLAGFVVVKKALVKVGVKLDSAKVGSLPVGTVLTALEVQGNRVRCSRGWVSIVSSKGDTLLAASPSKHGTQTAAAEAPRDDIMAQAALGIALCGNKPRAVTQESTAIEPSPKRQRRRWLASDSEDEAGDGDGDGDRLPEKVETVNSPSEATEAAAEDTPKAAEAPPAEQSGTDKTAPATTLHSDTTATNDEFADGFDWSSLPLY